MDGNAKSLAECGQVVTLGIGNEVFAVPVERVREILDLAPITHLPYAPPYLCGLVDVRGQGVAVVDLRLKLGLPGREPTAHTRILVLEHHMAGNELALGLLADRVFEVTALDAGPPITSPEIGRRWKSDYIDRIGRRGQNFVIVLDLAALFADDDP
ncbi:MAG TPA: chemotaxis protein CheW, partial [Magnetospirillum sp.]|nr:chemotaxis protein CheW [Magnetospirillum sp.]